MAYSLLINLHLLTLLESHWGFGTLLALIWMGCIPLIIRFIRHPSTKRAKSIDPGASFCMLVIYLLVIIATFMKTGFTWPMP